MFGITWIKSRILIFNIVHHKHKYKANKFAAKAIYSYSIIWIDDGSDLAIITQ